MYKNLKIVHITNGLTKAYIIKSKLESEGIDVQLVYESISEIIGLTADGLGEVKILVKEKDFDIAKKIITNKSNSGY
jgi:hypothetical protein